MVATSKCTHGKYLSQESREQLKQEAIERQLRRRWKRLGTLAAMVLGNGILILMITAGKIDTLCGVLFVAALSALCGNKAR